MDSTLIIVVALGAAMAGFVQGLSGFGFGLTAMALWAWTLEPMLAAALSVFGSLTGQVIAAVTVRRGFNLARLAPFLLGGLAGLPLGIYLLPRLDVLVFKAVLGTLLVTWCPLLLASNRLPRIDLSVRPVRALDWIRAVDPALRQVGPDRQAPILVVHRLLRPEARFDDGADGSLPFADPAETLLDLYDMRLVEQADDFIQALRRKGSPHV